MKLPKDLLSNLYKKPNIFLCETDKTKICKLETTETKGSFKFNGLSEISFEVARVYNDLISGETKVNPYYDKIEALRLVYVEGFGYFELQGPELISDGIKESKTCKAYALEYTLAQKYLEDFYINTGEHGSVEVTVAGDDDIVPVSLYNPARPELSLLDLVLEKDYGNWTIGHVDYSLRTLSRKFEIDRQSIYDFLINEICEKFNCYIVFDTINNKINLYAESRTAKFIGDGATNVFTITPSFADVNTVSVNGYKTTRWTYDSTTGKLTLEDIPEANAHIEVVDGALADWETDVFISFDNLSQEININYDADSIKTVLTVTYGDDGTIREVNLGLPYLTDLSYYYTVDWMGQDLYNAYTAYLQKSNKCQIEYADNAQQILELQNKISFAKEKTSLGYGMASNVNDKTVGTYYVISGGSYPNYFYTEVSLPSDYNANTVYYKLNGANITERKVMNLFSAVRKFFVAAYGQSEPPKYEDAATKSGKWEELLEKETESFAFAASDFATLKRSFDLDAPERAASAFKSFLDKIWTELGATPLEKFFLEPYKQIQSSNVSAGFSITSSPYYYYYYPVTIMINSLNQAINKRQREIAPLEKELKIYQEANGKIADSLLMDNNFTDGQLARLSAFLREDELQLDDIIETSLDDIDGVFKVKQDAMESGRIELQKLCQPQLQFSMSMANIYALPEFEPIIDQFQLGNVIKVALRSDYIKNSRLLQVDINFDDFSDFSCEFGELTNLRTQSDIHADLLSNAISAGKSVATNSSYWTRGADTANSTDLKIQQGLLDATTQIKAIDGTQGVVIDKYGIRLQKVDPTNGEIDPHQTWMVNNMILMSDDGFKTSRSALGQVTVDGHEYYGLISELVLAGYIEGSKMVGGTIRIGEYIDPEDGKKKYHFEVDENGNITMSATNSIAGYVTQSSFEFTESNLRTEFEKKIADGDASVRSWAEQTAEGFTATVEALGPKINYYGICSTEADVANKRVELQDCENFKIGVGTTISVKFDHENTAESPTLSVYGSKDEMAAINNITAYGEVLSGDSLYDWMDNSTVVFVYDGETWNISDSGSLGRSSQIKQTVNTISSAVFDEFGNSQIEQTAGSIRSWVKTELGGYSTTEQTAEKIKNVVEESDKKYSTMEQTAKDITLAVNGVKVGGRNLLLKSDVEQYTRTYRVAEYTPSEYLVEGQEYTISLCITPAYYIDQYRVYLSNGYAQQTVLDVSGTSKQIVSATFTATYASERTPSADKSNGLIKIYLPHEYNGTTYGYYTTIHWAKIEKGNKATDWTPAPEEMATEKSLAELKIEVDKISASVTDPDTGYGSQLSVLQDQISACVTESELKGTQLTINSESVRLAWNNCSDYIKLANGTINIYKSTTTNDANLLMKLSSSGLNLYNNGSSKLLMQLNKDAMNFYDCNEQSSKLVTSFNKDGIDTYNSDGSLVMTQRRNGMWYYYYGSPVGGMRATIDGDTAKRGVDIGIDYGSQYISWSHENRDGTWSSVLRYRWDKVSYPNNIPDLDIFAAARAYKGLYVSSNTTLQVYSGVDVDFFSDINMNNKQILNSSFGPTSDARLKTNIRNCSIDALDIINRIEMKEFDWIKTGDHEDIGMIAQQLQSIEPNFVGEDKSNNGQLFIKYDKIIPYLIKAVKELSNYVVNNDDTTIVSTSWKDPYTDEEKKIFTEKSNHTNREMDKVDEKNH